MADDFDEKMNALMGRMAAWKSSIETLQGSTVHDALPAPEASSSTWDVCSLGSTKSLQSTARESSTTTPATHDSQSQPSSDLQSQGSALEDSAFNSQMTAIEQRMLAWKLKVQVQSGQSAVLEHAKTSVNPVQDTKQCPTVEGGSIEGVSTSRVATPKSFTEPLLDAEAEMHLAPVGQPAMSAHSYSETLSLAVHCQDEDLQGQAQHLGRNFRMRSSYSSLYSSASCQVAERLQKVTQVGTPHVESKSWTLATSDCAQSPLSLEQETRQSFMSSSASASSSAECKSLTEPLPEPLPDALASALMSVDAKATGRACNHAETLSAPAFLHETATLPAQHAHLQKESAQFPVNGAAMSFKKCSVHSRLNGVPQPVKEAAQAGTVQARNQSAKYTIFERAEASSSLMRDTRQPPCSPQATHSTFPVTTGKALTEPLPDTLSAANIPVAAQPSSSTCIHARPQSALPVSMCCSSGSLNKSSSCPLLQPVHKAADDAALQVQGSNLQGPSRAGWQHPEAGQVLESTGGDRLLQRVDSLEESMHNMESVMERLIRSLVNQNPEFKDAVHPGRRSKAMTQGGVVRSASMDALPSALGPVPEHEPIWASNQHQESTPSVLPSCSLDGDCAYVAMQRSHRRRISPMRAPLRSRPKWR